MNIARKGITNLQDHIDARRIISHRNEKVTTCVVFANTFHEAHAVHQDYLAKNPFGHWYVSY